MYLVAVFSVYQVAVFAVYLVALFSVYLVAVFGVELGVTVVMTMLWPRLLPLATTG